VELEDWAVQLSNEQWQEYLGGLPDERAKAYRSIVNTAYLNGYRQTLWILLGAIGSMLLVSFLLKENRLTEKEMDS